MDIKNKQQKVAIVGIGRVGLPLALVLADSGFIVYGIGRDPKKIDRIKQGKMPFIEKGADHLLKKYINSRFIPTTSYKIIKDVDIAILTLGTPIDENMNPVYDQIDIALKSMEPYLREGQLLILRSTVAPETTEYVKLFINDIRSLKVGKNFYLAFCPERIAEGQAIEEIRSIPQIIGGVDIKSTQAAENFFKQIGVECLITDCISAELAKLFTNMYRYLSFAVANEFMVIASNYHKDIYEIVNLVNKNYKRGGLALPGLTAGPCLFKDGLFLISDLPYADLILTSWKINESIPLFLVKKVRERLKLDGKKAVILGLAFKPEIDDIRESLSFKVRKAFLRERAKVVLHDPYVVDYSRQVVEKDVYKALEGAEIVFIATNHKVYQELDQQKLRKIVNKNCVICDVWNVFKTDKIVFTINSLNNNKYDQAKVSRKSVAIY